MEASAIPASVGLGRSRLAIGASLLRIRSDEQLVTLFREGNDEAFRVIHDRYRARMFAYARQMLGPSGQDPEDAVQEIFMRAYYGLRANRRELALRAWLYRIAHNRCIDDLRRPQLVAIDARDSPAGSQDPVVRVEQRDALRRLIADVQRLPDQQRSALLMRELSGMSYAEVSGALGVSVPAVKSLLVRARVGLAQASEARNTACSAIRADLVLARDRGVRASGLARRHLRECHGCRQFRSEVRGVNRQLAALTPTLGPLGIIANLLGWGGGGAATTGGSAVAGSGAAAAGGSAVTVGGSAAGVASAGLLAGGAGHVATLLAAAVVTAGGAVEIQNTLSAVAHHPHHARVAHAIQGSRSGANTAADAADPAAIVPGAASVAGAPGANQVPASTGLPQASFAGAIARRRGARATPITMLLDPDMYSPQNLPPPIAPPAASNPGATSGAPVTSPATPAPGTATSPAGAGSTPAAGASASSSDPSTGTASSTAAAPTSAAASNSGTTTAGSTSSSAGPATSSGAGSTSAGASTSSSSAKQTSSGSSSTVGSSTTSAGARKVVSLIAHRRRRGSRMLDTLLVP